MKPSFSGLNCTSAQLSPSSYTSGVPYVGVIKVPYTGGNGGMYTGGNSVTVNGLTIKLQDGKLETGAGELTFNVSGTPTVSSPTDTTFTIDNNLVPFMTGSCSVTVGYQSTADISNVAFAGPLVYTTDNGRAGYHFVASTPDGKWSVRCFLPTSSAFADVNLQLRYSGSSTDPASKDIISNTTYMWGGGNTTQNNQVRFPKNQWAGNNGTDGGLVIATGQTAGNFPAWSDPHYFVVSLSSDKVCYNYFFWHC